MEFANSTIYTHKKRSMYGTFFVYYSLMKKALLVLVFLISTEALTAQEIAWMSMDQALLAQQQTPKKIFMDVYTTWCGPCKLLR